jgi:pyruvate kinase
METTPFLMTKIIATLGPATSDFETIQELITSGVRVFRINFSHGTFEEYDQLVANIRQAGEETGINVGILGDLSGPKIRVGNVIKKGVMLEEGMEISFVKHDVTGGSRGNEFTFSTTYPQFIDEVKPGERILLDDGNLEVKPIRKTASADDRKLVCEVLVGGLLTRAKGVNLPDTRLSLPSLTEKDYRCVDYAQKRSFDFLALSFVRTAKDVKMLKDKLHEIDARPEGLDITAGDLGFSTTYESSYIPIVSKIEKPQAIDNLEEIISETDGVMVARGDLGVEMDLAEVALLQKKIVRMCLQQMKPVIVATQMLQSMINDPVPTRAEVSDVANAIMDGADAVMLSGETAVGKYPVKAVGMMNRVAQKTAEYRKEEFSGRGKFMSYEGVLKNKGAMARSVHLLSRDIQAKYIITWSHSGGSTVFLSQQRMEIPIIAFGENHKRLHQMSILYSITPVYMKQPKSGSKFIEAVNKVLLKNNWAQRGDKVIVVASSPITKRGVTNRVVIHEVGESLEE